LELDFVYMYEGVDFMKKLFLLGLTLTSLTVLAACGDLFGGDEETNDDFTQIEQTNSLAILGYLSEGFLSTEEVALDSTLFLNTLTTETVEEPLVIEEEIDEVNIYLDKLKMFMDNGANPIASIEETVSDLAEYTTLITFTINDQTYKIYFIQDEETLEFTGLLILDEVEYTLEGFSSLEFKKRVREHVGDTELDEPNDINPANVDEDGEIEEKIVLKATNGDDYIQVTYKKEETDTDTEMKLRIQKSIDSVESTEAIKIYQEENQYKVRIDEGENFYMFKKQVEDDGTKYMLNYRVEGTNGVIRIKETVNDLGETEYDYFINENGKDKVITKRPGHSRRNTL